MYFFSPELRLDADFNYLVGAMRRRSQFPGPALGPLLLLLLPVVAFQTSLCQDIAQADGGQSKTYKLEGTVVNSVTGEPIRRALVEVLGSGWPPVLTGVDGKFAFANLPRQEWTLQITKPGFFYGAEGNVFQVKSGETPVTIRMVPEAVLTGRVETRDGEPVERALVRVMAENFNMGRVQHIQIGQTVTDEDGNFRVANLHARRCWAAVQPNQVSVRTVANDLQGVKEGYPAVVYYPAARDINSATPVQLFPGKESEVKFLLGSEPIFQISGSIVGTPPGQYPQLRVFNVSGEELNLARQINQQTGSFEIRRVPAGGYVLQCIMHTADGHLLTAEVTVTVQANVTDLHLVVVPARTIPVVVHSGSFTIPEPTGGDGIAFSDHSPAIPWAQIQLRPLDPARQEFARFLGYNQPREFHDVVPGRYAMEVTSSGDRFYIQSARSAGVDLLSEPLVVLQEGDVPPIEMVLRDDGATISGKIRGPKVPNMIVVVVPEKHSIQGPRIAMVGGAQNQFSIMGMPPGDYRVYAFDSQAQIEYANPAALEPYSSKGVRVSLPPRGESDVDLELTRIGE